MMNVSLRSAVIPVFFGAVLGIVATQSFFGLGESETATVTPMEPTEECRGEALSIPFAYNWGPVDPHSCKVQCDDGKLRYLVYTNGMATQCEELPGCLDYGEDHGVTCRIPGQAEGESLE